MSGSERREAGFLSALRFGWSLLVLAWKAFAFLSHAAARLFSAKRGPREHAVTSGRGKDRELQSDAQMRRRESVGTILIACCFSLAMLGGVGFLVGYWWGRNNTQWLGGTLALFLCGMALTLVLWAHWLMSEKVAIEPRHPVASTALAEEAAVKAFCGGVHDVRRRGLLVGMGLSGAGLFGMMVLSLMRGLGLSPDKTLYGRIWKGGQRLVTEDGKPLELASLEPGSMAVVFPEDQIGAVRAQTVLIRVKDGQLQLPEERANWAPAGYVAYSRVCTHAGCPVGEYETEQSILLCPCHQSSFDVLRGGIPTGGPAARPLPQLPLYADADGTLRASGEFTAPPGPSFWSIQA